MTRSIFLVMLVVLSCILSVTHASDYLIKTGDTLGITVLEEPDLTKRVVVDPQGSISLPLINEVSVGGMTVSQATQEVAKRLRKFMKNPQVSIELVDSAKLQVTVSGDVKTPGVYVISSGARIMDVITMAGGYNQTADLSRVSISRSGGSPIMVDLGKFIITADASENVPVTGGDTVFVPTRQTEIIGSVQVIGAVRQAGQHQIVRGMTAREAIMLAGGPTEFADLSNITLRRAATGESMAVDYMAGDPIPDESLQLKPGDVVFVGIQKQFGYYSISGAVNSPGRYELKGKTSITEAIAIAGGVKDRAKLGSVRILRNSDGQTRTLQADVSSIMKGKAENITLQDQDTIWIGEGKQKPDLMKIISLGLSLGWLLSKH